MGVVAAHRHSRQARACRRAGWGEIKTGAQRPAISRRGRASSWRKNSASYFTM